MADRRAKLAYSVTMAVLAIVRTATAATFDTFTFVENLTDKREAERRWRRLKARLRRHYSDLCGVGAWQRQRRGAWHLHYVFNMRLDVVLVREWAKECGFGWQLNMRAVGQLPGMKEGWSVLRVAQYLTRYMTRDMSEADKGVRLVDYMGNSRKGTVLFAWAKGLGRLYRLGCKAWVEEEMARRGPGACEVVMGLRDFWLMVSVGWRTLNGAEQLAAELESEAVAMWLRPERYPF